MGIATTNIEGRITASLGLGPAAPLFEAHNGLDYGGVLFLLPALLSQGLLTIKDTHQLKAGYYNMEAIVLTVAFMALCRIKSPEQLKQCNPGELGRLIGLDRVPELKCLRRKLQELTSQDKASMLAEKLALQWLPPDEENLFLYVDGHVRIYNGYLAKLTAKYVSRQKLCLSATTEFWVNDAQGQPLLVCTGELSEKLQHAIEQNIIPQLISSNVISVPSLIDETTPASCTLVFDREAYEPAFFMRLWMLYRIAVITYHKNVKDKWDTDNFKNEEVTIGIHQKTMQLCEKQTLLDGYAFRQVRCLTESGHQTAVLCTNPALGKAQLAGAMFNRWTQENFFKYMISDYSFDHIIEYGTQTIDHQKEVVNPLYRQLTQQIKKEAEKLQRLQARLLQKIDAVANLTLDQFAKAISEQSALTESIEIKQKQINILKEKRKAITPKIKLAQMADNKRYNKLKTESKLLMNTIKMICYRAETALANLISNYFKRGEEEKRMLIKQIIQTPADINPDHQNNTLTIHLHTLSAARYNEAAQQLTMLLNQTETIFPGTKLKLIFKVQ